jgi:DNA ligase (NAD+)
VILFLTLFIKLEKKMIDKKTLEKMKKLGIPTNCPGCDSVLEWYGVDIKCTNKNCSVSTTKQVMHFLENCGMENVSETSLKNWNITDFDKLLAWTPDNYKSQQKFYTDLNTTVFNKVDYELFSKFSFDGAGETNINKILNHYCIMGYPDVALTISLLYLPKRTVLDSYPEGIGQTTIDKLRESFLNNARILEKIKNDKRYKPIVVKKEISMGGILEGKTFLLTGTLSKKRNLVEAEIESFGGKIASSVTAKLDYLICGEDQIGSSSKWQKAKQLNINIITETDYNEMIK